MAGGKLHDSSPSAITPAPKKLYKFMILLIFLGLLGGRCGRTRPHPPEYAIARQRMFDGGRDMQCDQQHEQAHRGVVNLAAQLFGRG